MNQFLSFCPSDCLKVHNRVKTITLICSEIQIIYKCQYFILNALRILKYFMKIAKNNPHTFFRNFQLVWKKKTYALTTLLVQIVKIKKSLFKNETIIK